MPPPRLPYGTIRGAGAFVKLGREGRVPNNPRDKALSAIHQGLANDVPLGIGKVLEANLQAQLDLTQQGINLNGVNQSNITGEIEDLQTQFSAFAASQEGAFGQEQTENALNLIWSYQVEADSVSPAWQMLAQAYHAGAIINTRMMLRTFTSVNFLTHFNGFNGSQGFDDGVYLNDAYEGARLNPDETDLEMLERLYPDYEWSDNYLNTHMTGCSIPNPTYGESADYFYSPPPPSLREIKELMRYTPSSGPPDRYAWTDVVRLISLIPVQW